MDLAVNAGFGFLTCLICQAAMAVDAVKHQLTNLHQTQSHHDDNLCKAAISATKVAPMIPSNTTGPRQIVHGLKFMEAMQDTTTEAGGWRRSNILGGGGNTDSAYTASVPGRLLAQGTGAHTPSGANTTGQSHDRTGELVLQRLSSPDPTKSGISNTPFHKHLYKSTMKQYILPVVALLFMLIRQEYSVKDFTGSNNKLMKLLEVWSMAWTHQGDGDIVDPTKRCLALMMLRQDGAFKDPQEVTPVIAGLEYCMCPTFLKEIHQCMHLDTDSDELGQCIALESFFTEKTWYTFSCLQSLQHRASLLAYDTWVSLKYDLCKVFQETEAKLVQIWEEGILMGQDIRVEYDQIADDLINKDIGYSFQLDARNPQLRYLFSHFAKIWEGKIIWNRSALQAWLRSYAELQSLLLLQAQMLSGAPSCGTELTAMTYYNTQTQPTCNLVVLGKHISLLCQYLKTTVWTEKDKLIPHAPDAITSNIWVQDLALARPFAEVAARPCFPEKPEVVDLLPILNFGLTNSWKHIQTAWKSLAGAAEDILPAYLNASIDWQRHCQVPLSGQSTSYKKARESKQPDKQLVTYSAQSTEEIQRVANAVVEWLPSTEDIAAKVLEKLIPALKGILQEAMPSLEKGKGKGKAKESRGTEQGSIFSGQGIGQDQDQEIGKLEDSPSHPQ
ncbi:hypothetical protein F5141DRAFT_1066756 [Pisolithus sp. B1]|nr:hypothetical protein F5141DRAFT_1066756 [Pisolithus sp. B1]